MSALPEIQKIMREAEAITRALADDAALHARIEEAAEAMCAAFRRGGRALFCGNGGSAADAQHFAAELTGKFLFDRAPLDAEALHINSSYITAFANDSSFEGAYARLVRAKGRAGDVLFAISTSGNSENIILALRAAKELGMRAIALTGAGGGKAAAYADILLAAPSSVTPRIQECHVLIGHIICRLVEERELRL